MSDPGPASPADITAGAETDAEARDRTVSALSRAALAVSRVCGERILADLLHHLTAILGAEVAFIAVYARHEPPLMRTLALVIDDAVVSNVEYDLEGTPCEQVVGQEFRYYSGDLLQRFPGDAMLPELSIETYAAFPLYDTDNRPLGLIAVLSRGPMHDVPLIEAMLKIFAVRVTGAIEQKRADERRSRLEMQLRQAQKMEAIGQLTGGIAHDFNNILTSVMGHLVLASEGETTQGDARLRRYLEQAQLSCERARDLIRQMLTFSRGGRGEARPVELGGRIHETVRLLRSTLPTTIEIDTGIAGDLPSVLADPVHIDQILLNLCINARDAMTGDGRIRIEVATVAIADAVCASCRQPVSGDLVVVSVADNGPGIDPAIIDRMFEPFFSTKEIGKGSGMGLATVHGIVHEHGGHILVDSTPGSGASFRVLLPPVRTSTDDAGEPLSSANHATQRQPLLSGSVLVVEDDPAVGEFMRDLLQVWGLSVTLAPGGIEAWEAFRKNPDAFDIVITDQTMPRIGGLELARRLHTARADLPVVLYSAYLEGLDDSMLDDAGVTAVLAKPIDPARLLEILQSNIQGSSVHLPLCRN